MYFSMKFTVTGFTAYVMCDHARNVMLLLEGRRLCGVSRAVVCKYVTLFETFVLACYGRPGMLHFASAS